MATAYQATAAENRYYASRARDTASFEIGQSRARADQRIARVGAQYGLMADTVASIGSVLTQTVGNYYQFKSQQNTMAMQLAQQGRAHELDLRRLQIEEKNQQILQARADQEVIDKQRDFDKMRNTPIFLSHIGETTKALTTGATYDEVQLQLNSLTTLITGAEPGTVDSEVMTKYIALQDTVAKTFTVDTGEETLPFKAALAKLKNTEVDPKTRVRIFNEVSANPQLGDMLRGQLTSFEGSADPKFAAARAADKRVKQLALKMETTAANVEQMRETSLQEKLRAGMKMPQALAARQAEEDEILASLIDNKPPGDQAPGAAVTLPKEDWYRRLTTSPEEYPQYAKESVLSGGDAVRMLGTGNQKLELTDAAYEKSRGFSLDPILTKFSRFVDIGPNGVAKEHTADVKLSNIKPASISMAYSPVVESVAAKNPDMTVGHAALVSTVDSAAKVMETTSSPLEFKKAASILMGAVGTEADLRARTRAPVPGIGSEVLSPKQMKTLEKRATEMGVDIKPVQDMISNYRVVKPEGGGNAILQQLAAPGASGPAQTIVVPFKGKKRTLELPQGAVVDSANKTVRLGDRIMTFDEMADMKFAGEAP